MYLPKDSLVRSVGSLTWVQESQLMSWQQMQFIETWLITADWNLSFLNKNYFPWQDTKISHSQQFSLRIVLIKIGQLLISGTSSSKGSLIFSHKPVASSYMHPGYLTAIKLSLKKEMNFYFLIPQLFNNRCVPNGLQSSLTFTDREPFIPEISISMVSNVALHLCSYSFKLYIN